MSLESVVSAGLDVIVLEEGFEGFKRQPLYGVAVGADGSVVVVRYAHDPDRPEAAAEILEEPL